MHISISTEMLLTCLTWVVIFIPAGILLYLVLWPVRMAELQRQRPTQFHVADTIWLIVWMQIALAGTTTYVPELPHKWIHDLAVGFSACAVPVAWWGCIRTLSRAGVHSAVRRVAFLAVIVPAAWLAALGCGFALADAVGLLDLGGENREWPERSEIPSRVPRILLTVILAPATVWALRRLTLWALEEPTGNGTAPAATTAEPLGHRNQASDGRPTD